MDSNNSNFFQQWFDNQMEWSKRIFNNSEAKEGQSKPNSDDWINKWQDWTNNDFSSWTNLMKGNPYHSMMDQHPLSHMGDLSSKMKEGMNQWGVFTKQYFDAMNIQDQDWYKQFQNMTSAESFKGMGSLKESFGKFFELWSPMIKSIQNNTFSMDHFARMFDAEKFKSFIDSSFKFLPDEAKKLMDQMSQGFLQGMKQMSEMNLNPSNGLNFKMPNMSGSGMPNATHIWDMYNTWRNSMNEQILPLTKLMQGNASVEKAKIWSDIIDMSVEHNLKSTQMQMMTYKASAQAMERVAKHVAEKVQKGEQVESMIGLYQYYLMSGDTVFTELFESDEYSKIMTEVSSLKQRIKAAVDIEMEKTFFVNMPVATRTEMDEVYKTIYELKKTVRNLERALAEKNTSPNNEIKKEEKQIQVEVKSSVTPSGIKKPQASKSNTKSPSKGKK